MGERSTAIPFSFAAWIISSGAGNPLEIINAGISSLHNLLMMIKRSSGIIRSAKLISLLPNSCKRLWE